jgi:ABC-type transport system substrate-binding protein
VVGRPRPDGRRGSSPYPARFHNGERVTAADAKFSFERSRGICARTLKEYVAAVDAPDPARLRIRLKQPWPDFMSHDGMTAASAGGVVPRKYVAKARCLSVRV